MINFVGHVLQQYMYMYVHVTPFLCIDQWLEMLTLLKNERYNNIMLTHWLLELFAKNAFLDILEVLRLDLGQISFNMVEKAFATWQLALLATRITFYDLLALACTEIKWVTYVFRLFDFWIFFPFPFLLSFSFLLWWLIFYWAGLQPIFTMEQLGVVARNFALSFSLIFLSIFVHISGSIRPLPLI